MRRWFSARDVMTASKMPVVSSVRSGGYISLPVRIHRFDVVSQVREVTEFGFLQPEVRRDGFWLVSHSGGESEGRGKAVEHDDGRAKTVDVFDQEHGRLGAPLLRGVGRHALDAGQSGVEQTVETTCRRLLPAKRPGPRGKSPPARPSHLPCRRSTMHCRVSRAWNP